MNNWNFKRGRLLLQTFRLHNIIILFILSQWNKKFNRSENCFELTFAVETFEEGWIFVAMAFQQTFLQKNNNMQAGGSWFEIHSNVSKIVYVMIFFAKSKVKLPCTDFKASGQKKPITFTFWAPRVWNRYVLTALLRVTDPSI